jgi:hypothetical protein
VPFPEFSGLNDLLFEGLALVFLSTNQQGPAHGAIVEPQPIAGGFAPLQVDRGHSPSGQ